MFLCFCVFHVFVCSCFMFFMFRIFVFFMFLCVHVVRDAKNGSGKLEIYYRACHSFYIFLLEENFILFTDYGDGNVDGDGDIKHDTSSKCTGHTRDVKSLYFVGILMVFLLFFSWVYFS